MRKWSFFYAVALIVFVSHSALGQIESTIDGDYLAKGNDWRFIISPYALLAGQSTDVGGKQLRQSFNDVYSLTNFGFQLAANVIYRDWILTVDGTYADLRADDEGNILRMDLNIKQTILDLRLGYLVLNRVDLEDHSGVVRGWTLEVNAGTKYWRNNVTMGYEFALGDLPPLAEGQVETIQEWWDPMIGARARIILSRTVNLGLYMSGGGFGIGGASDFAWDLLYANTFKVSNHISITAGFRFFHYKRVEGEGDEELETAVSVYGPLLGVSFVF